MFGVHCSDEVLGGDDDDGDDDGDDDDDDGDDDDDDNEVNLKLMLENMTLPQSLTAFTINNFLAIQKLSSINNPILYLFI